MAEKTIVFGLATYKGIVAGVHLQSVTYTETASPAEATAEDGNIEQIDYYAKKKTIQCQGNVTAYIGEVHPEIPTLSVGGELTVGEDTFTIESIILTESVNGHKTAQINGTSPVKSSEG